MTEIQEIIDFSAFDLFIFDLDGTLTEYKTGKLLDGVESYFQSHDPRIKLAIASNQGGVGLRYWMIVKGFGNPANYPTTHDVELSIENVQKQLGVTFDVYTSFMYQSKKGEWSPIPENGLTDPRWLHAWRKPRNGMLLEAMKNAGVAADRTLMIGDWDEDREAANYAGCFFVYAHQFFSRPKPEDVA